MVYSGLYRCSGCSVTFSDPSAWREASGSDDLTAQTTVYTATRTSSVPAHARVPNLSTWGVGATAPGLGGATPRGRSDEDLRAIREAAARANSSKAKGSHG